MSDFKDKLSNFLSMPEVQQVQKELSDYIIEQYNVFDNTNFIGTDFGGFVKVHYMFSKKGFYYSDIDNAAFEDKEFLKSCIPSAINDALIKYGNEDKAVKERIYKREQELYNKMVELAKQSVSAENVTPSFTPPKPKKNYLN